MADDKTTGLGTTVWVRQPDDTNPCDLAITDINDGLYTKLGCAYSVEPPGTSWTTVEEAQCLDGENEAAIDWTTGQLYNLGQLIKESTGKIVVVSVAGASITAGDSTDLVAGGSDTSDHEYVNFVPGATDPAAQLGKKEADEMALTRTFSPGGTLTEQLRAWASGAIRLQFVYQYPVQLDDAMTPYVPYDTFCGFIRVADPEAVEPETFMRATYTILRDGAFASFKV